MSQCVANSIFFLSLYTISTENFSINTRNKSEKKKIEEKGHKCLYFTIFFRWTFVFALTTNSVCHVCLSFCVKYPPFEPPLDGEHPFGLAKTRTDKKNVAIKPLDSLLAT